jgi:hypothetical protein
MRGLTVRVPAMIALIGVLGCGSKAPPDTSLGMATPDTGSVTYRERVLAPADPKTSQPIAAFTADEFTFQKLENMYDFVKRHNAQLVEVSGRVESVGTQPNGWLSLRLVGRSAKGTKPDYVVNEPTPLPNIQPGQTVTLRGMVQGGLVVPNWMMHKQSGDTPQTVTATDFLKEYEAAEDATKAKREGKFFILTGEIGQIELPNPEAKVCTLRLKAGTGTVAAVFTNVEKTERARNAEFKVGASVKLVGECELGTLRLVRCSIVAE